MAKILISYDLDKVHSEVKDELKETFNYKDYFKTLNDGRVDLPSTTLIKESNNITPTKALSELKQAVENVSRREGIKINLGRYISCNYNSIRGKVTK